MNNAGGPPPGDFREWDREAWLRALDANMLTPIFLIKATVDGMISAALRPHRQHHVGLGEVADRYPRSLERRARRAHRLRRRPGPQDRRAQRHDQQHPARALRHRPAPLDDRDRREGDREIDRGRRPASGRLRTRRGASAPPPSSARCARSSAALRPGTSPGRTSCSTGALTRAPSSSRSGATGRRGQAVVREGSPDHAARVRCSSAAGLHLGARHPISPRGNGSGRPLPHHRLPASARHPVATPLWVNACAA